MSLVKADDEVLDYEDAEEVVVPNGNGVGDHNLENGVEYMQEDLPYAGKASAHTAEFKDLMLKPELLRAIQEAGFEHPSEVQAECIPKAVLGVDVLCQAKSGMGKTAVFVISTLQEMDVNDPKQPSVVVLLPTRELAYQTAMQYRRFKKHLPYFSLALFFGGIAYEKDISSIRKNPNGIHIVIGTPGRMSALVRDKNLDLSGVKHFVVDECDKMLHSEDMREQIKVVFDACPAEKQVLMFSATLPKKILPVCRELVKENAYEVIVDDDSKLALEKITHYYNKTKENEKIGWLGDLLDTVEFNQIIIFVNTVERAKMLGEHLFDSNFPSVMIHSGMVQDERLARYQQFKSFQSRILVATDLFGRGMDIERVNVVVNYDCPYNVEQYLHRIARGGRFGRKGLAITLVAEEKDSDTLNAVQDRYDIMIEALPCELDESLWQ